MSLNLEKQLTFVSSPPKAPVDSAGTIHGILGCIACCTTYSVHTEVTDCLQYGAYHHNQVNIIIHMICVPLILFSFFEIVGNPLRLLLAVVCPNPT
jgi:hypothetical protein